MKPITRKEQFIAAREGVCEMPKPLTRDEVILAGGEIEPLTRDEVCLMALANGGGGGGGNFAIFNVSVVSGSVGGTFYGAFLDEAVSEYGGTVTASRSFYADRTYSVVGYSENPGLPPMSSFRVKDTSKSYGVTVGGDNLVGDVTYNAIDKAWNVRIKGDCTISIGWASN